MYLKAFENWDQSSLNSAKRRSSDPVIRNDLIDFLDSSRNTTSYRVLINDSGDDNQ
jgi:hypothetical protein